MYRLGAAYAYTWHSLLALRHLDSAESAGQTASAGCLCSSEAGALSCHATSASLPSLLLVSLSECDLQSDEAPLRRGTILSDLMLWSDHFLDQMLLCKTVYSEKAHPHIIQKKHILI